MLYSDRILGWALDRSMKDSLTLTAPRMALARRAVEPGLVHFRPRLARTAQDQRHRHQHVAQWQPVGQRVCESFMKTLENEEVLRDEYWDILQATLSFSWQKKLTLGYYDRRLRIANVLRAHGQPRLDP
jgi:hypothetical protein